MSNECLKIGVGDSVCFKKFGKEYVGIICGEAELSYAVCTITSSDFISVPKNEVRKTKFSQRNHDMINANSQNIMYKQIQYASPV